MSGDALKAVISVSGSREAAEKVLSSLHEIQNSLRLIFQEAEKITCCEADLKADGETLVYLHDDYQYTLTNMWVSEQAEETFLKENGPQP